MPTKFEVFIPPKALPAIIEQVRQERIAFILALQNDRVRDGGKL
jgi:hypothetical protein